MDDKKLKTTLPDPTKTAPENCTESCVVTGHLVVALRGPGGVPGGETLYLPTREEGGGAETERPEGRGGPGREPSGVPGPRRKPIAAGNKYGGVADGAAVNGKWSGTGCAVMARCPLPYIWPRAPRPTPLLRRLQQHFLYMPCPRL